jgi:thymidylate kinase
MPAYPNFVLFEGLDGSGKTTLARAFTGVLAGRGFKVFDIAAHGKSAGEIPLPWKPEKDLIFSAEPTHSWVGAAIRRELIRNGTGYDGKIVAEAYSLDRYILYRRFLLPMLQAGALVVSDRNAATSMIYQPIMENPMPLEEVLMLPGNRQALEHAPGHLIIAKVPAKVCISRINARADKKDDAVFEKEAFLAKAAERYESNWFRELWEKQGTEVHYLDASQPLETAKAEAARLANEIFPALS